MEKKLQKNISYILEFIDSARFIDILSNFVDNLSEGIHKIKCKYGTVIKNVKLVELRTKYATVFLNTQTLRVI